MAVKIINTEEFKELIYDFSSGEEFVFAKEKPIILNFFATWCGPCQMFRPILEAAADKHAGQMDVYKIDIDADPLIPTLFGIKSVPTTVFFAPGEEPALASGVIGEEGLDQALLDLFKIG